MQLYEQSRYSCREPRGNQAKTQLMPLLSNGISSVLLEQNDMPTYTAAFRTPILPMRASLPLPFILLCHGEIPPLRLQQKLSLYKQYISKALREGS